jgi:GSCFA family
VLALGSCFAAYFIEWLATNGYKQTFSDPLLVLARNPFENTAVIAQQFRWAFGEVDPHNLFWIDKDRQRNFATEEKRVAMRQAFMEADVFIATLSLSEVWYDKLTGEPLWRVMPTDCHDPQRHAFKTMSFAGERRGARDDRADPHAMAAQAQDHLYGFTAAARRDVPVGIRDHRQYRLQGDRARRSRRVPARAWRRPQSNLLLLPGL